MVRVGLLGTGTMGRTHALTYSGIGGARVVAVMGRDASTVEDLAARVGARAYTDIDDMFDAENLDVVDCCLPTPLHRFAVEKAAARGRHIICEKPLAATIDDAQAMVRVCRAAGIHLLVAQVVRFFPQYRALADALREGRVGTPVTCTLLRQGSYPAGRDNWYRDESQCGGIFLDLMIHDFDWALSELGPAERVYAQVVQRTGEKAFAQGTATVRHRSGALTQVTGTWGHPGTFTTMVEIAGSGGVLYTSSDDTAPLRVMAATAQAHDTDVSLPDLSGGENPYGTELAHFIDVIAGHTESLVHPEEALAAVRLALTARLSAHTGHAERIEDQEGAA